MRFELTTPTLARLCSTPELRPLGATADGQQVRKGLCTTHDFLTSVICAKLEGLEIYREKPHVGG
jgi:hypothetical protein